MVSSAGSSGSDPNKISAAKFGAASLASTLIPGASLVSLALGAKAAASALGDSDSDMPPEVKRTIYANGVTPDGEPVPIEISISIPSNQSLFEPRDRGG